MAVLIRDLETEGLIRELAARTGESITEAVKEAVGQRLKRLPPARGRINRAVLSEAQRYFENLPRRDEGLTDDEILGGNSEGHFG